MPQWGVRPPEAKPRRALYPSYGLLPSRGKRGLGVRSSPLHGFLFLSHGLGRLSQGLAGGAVVVGAFTDGLDRVASVIAACTRRLSQPLVAVDCGMLGGKSTPHGRQY